MDKQETLLEIHKMVSEELRHTSNVVWRFSVAIATLQGAALALSGQKDAHEVLGALAPPYWLSSIIPIQPYVGQAREGTKRIRRQDEGR